MGRRIFPITLVLAACCAVAAQAAEYSWSTDGGNWMTAGNWSPGTYSGSFTSDTGNTFTISSGTAVANTSTFANQLTVLNGGTLRISVNWVGASKLILGGGTISSTSGTTQIYNPTAASQSITVNDVDATSAVTTSTIDVSDGSTLYINSKFNAGAGGSGNLAKAGAGLLILNGSQSGGTWAGTFDINAGRVRLESNTTALSGGTLLVDGDQLDINSFNSGTVRIVSGGVATNINNGQRASTLRLDGGTLQGYNNWNYGDGGSTSKIYVDSASTLKGQTADQWMYIQAQLNGSGNLSIAGPGLVGLNNNVSGDTYSGEITVASGGTLRMQNDYGLSGGTVRLNGSTSPGLFRLGAGWQNGKVIVDAGGVAEADNNGEWREAVELRLNGGTLRSYNSDSNWYVGTGWSNSKLYVDSLSTIRASTASSNLYIGSQLYGSGSLQIAGPGVVQLRNQNGGNTYSGEISVAAGGTLRMDNEYGLSGGTVRLTNPTGVFRLGQGWQNGKVIVDAGGVAEADNNGEWREAVELRLNGGTLRSYNSDSNWYVGTGWSNSKLYVDSASTITASTANSNLYIGSQLNGSGNIEIAGPGRVQLRNQNGGSTYSGVITVGAGGLLRMDNEWGLSGGTVSVLTGGTFLMGQGFVSGTVNVSSGVFQVDDDWKTVSNLHLKGGTLRGAENQNWRVGTGDSNSKLYIDNASTLSAPTAGNSLGIAAQLNGSANLSVTGPGYVQLENGDGSTNYSGTITLDAGDLLRMGNQYGLGGGTVSVLTGGTFLMGEGFATGTVNVSAGGVFQLDNDWKTVSSLHLQGGSIRGAENQDWRIGTGDTNSNIYVDSVSTLSAPTVDRRLEIAAPLIGSSNLSVTGPGYVSFQEWGGAANNTGTFTGNWDIQGTLRLSNPSGGEWKGENLGGGTTVNVATGGVLQFRDNDSNNVWTLSKNLSGTGTVQITQQDDRLVIARNSANTVGGILANPGTLTFNWTEVNGNSLLEFGKNASDQRAVWHFNAVDGSTFGKVVSNVPITLANAKLVIDPTVPIPQTMMIYQGVNTQDLTAEGQQFGEVQWLYDTTGTLTYGATGTITVGNIVPVYWQGDGTGLGTSGTWTSSGTGNWDRLNPTSISMTELNNGGVCTVAGPRSLRNLIVKNSGSTMAVSDTGSLSATVNVDLQSGGAMTVASSGYVGTSNSDSYVRVRSGASLNVSGSLSTPTLQADGTTTFNSGSTLSATNVTSTGTTNIAGSVGWISAFSSSGTTNFNSGATGVITSLNVTDGTTGISTTGLTYTAINVPGGTYTGATLNFNNATASLSTLVVGTTGQSASLATITNSTITAGSVAVRKSSGSWAPSKLTVGSGGTLVLSDTSKYIADANSYSTGRYVLDAGGKIKFTSSIDMGTFLAQTEWNAGGILGIEGALENYNNRSLPTGQIVDFGNSGYLATNYGVTERLYLRGGEVRFGSGYARTAQLQFTEDLGTLSVSGGSLTNMPKNIPANVKLTGSAATWALGSNTTLGSDTTLTLKDGASVTIGTGKYLSLDSLVFEGTGGTIALGGGSLIHGGSKLQLVNINTVISGAGSLLVGDQGVSLGLGGRLQGASATERLNVYGNVSGSGFYSNVTVYGNVQIGNSPGVAWIQSNTTYNNNVNFDIGGTSGGTAGNFYFDTTYSRIIIDAATLTLGASSTATFNWWGGFQASAGDTFQIFLRQNGGTLSGTFSSITLPTLGTGLSWNTSNLYTTGQLTVISAVPEPGTLALLGCGVLLVGRRWLRRLRSA